MNYTITEESLDSLTSSWPSLQHLRWENVFVLPGWMSAWWREFGEEAEPYVRAVRQGKAVIGIAPLQLKDGKASFIGSRDVCDYLDFVVAPGREQEFFDVLLDDLSRKGISSLDLNCLRPDSTALVNLVAAARSRGYEVSCNQEDVSLEIDLPSTFEAYLGTLTPKQGREIRRKLRRLREAGEVDYRVTDEEKAIPRALDIFLKLLRQSRGDKAAFMNAKTESFFRVIAKNMSEAGLLRFGILELYASPVAAVMYFDYQNGIYLYNSGYDTRYSSLSVGLLCKILCLQDSIEKKRDKLDYMKGAEVYKYRLGSKEIPIHGCQIALGST